jgi:hypothetical protein
MLEVESDVESGMRGIWRGDIGCVGRAYFTGGSISVRYHRRGYRALCEGYLRALREDGSDNLSSFNAKTVRRKTEARHGPGGYQQVVISASGGISIW